MINKIGGRKFAMTFAVLLLGTAVEVWAPNGLSTSLAALLGTGLGLYAGANVFAKFSIAKTSKEMEWLKYTFVPAMDIRDKDLKDVIRKSINKYMEDALKVFEEVNESVKGQPTSAGLTEVQEKGIADAFKGIQTALLAINNRLAAYIQQGA